jgi:predicted lipoprotein with Yx(FWY)xxD motif
MATLNYTRHCFTKWPPLIMQDIVLQMATLNYTRHCFRKWPPLIIQDIVLQNGHL